MTGRPVPSRTAVRVSVAAVLTAAGLTASAATGPVPAGAASGCGAGARDTVPPAVGGVTLSPAMVDVRSRARSVTVTVKATDAAPSGVVAAGVSGVTAFLVSPPGNHVDLSEAGLQLVAGTATDGTWRGRVRIERWVTPGTWHLGRLIVTDAAGNSQDFFDGPAFGSAPSAPTDISFTSWDKAITVRSTVDNRRPTLTSLDITPASVDTTRRARTVRLRATATDTQSGVESVTVGLNNSKIPNARTTAILTRSRSSGVWAGTARVPTWARTSTWQATAFVLDRAGNEREYVEQDLAARGFASSLHVTSASDTRKPGLAGFDISPGAVDVTDSGATLSVRALATDARSGVTAVTAALVRADGSTLDTSLHLSSGDAHRGRWTGVLHVPRCAEPGTWRAVVEIADRAGNARVLGPSGLARRGYRSREQVTSVAVDRTAPAMAASGTAGEVDVTFSEGVQDVTTGNLWVYRSHHYRTPLSISGITCTNASGQPTDCSGTGTGGLVRHAVLDVGVAASTTYVLYADMQSVPDQVTDAAGNPVPWSQGTEFTVG